MKPTKDIDHATLEGWMREHLTKRGRSPEYIKGYIEAHKLGGFLKPTAPAWIRNSAAVHYLIPHPPTPNENDKP